MTLGQPNSLPRELRQRRRSGGELLVIALVIGALFLLMIPAVIFGGLLQPSDYSRRQPVVNIENRYIVAPTRTPVTVKP